MHLRAILWITWRILLRPSRSSLSPAAAWPDSLKYVHFALHLLRKICGAGKKKPNDSSYENRGSRDVTFMLEETQVSRQVNNYVWQNRTDAWKTYTANGQNKGTCLKSDWKQVEEDEHVWSIRIGKLNFAGFHRWARTSRLLVSFKKSAS